MTRWGRSPAPWSIPPARRPLTTLAAELGQDTDFAAVEETARALVTDQILVAEVRRIAALVEGIASDAARQAVAETMIAFDVYRSYLPEVGDSWSGAIAVARSVGPTWRRRSTPSTGR